MEISTKVPVGLSLIGFSIIFQIVCFSLMYCLSRKRQGGQTVAMRSWLFIASTFDQMVLLTFHLQYHYYIFPNSSVTFCIILRIISAFASTFTIMWIVVLTVFYFISTLNSANRVFLDSRFLSHCVTWSWSMICCVMYVVVTFLTENGGKSYLQASCWENIGDTVHLYFTHGYETIGLISIFICAIITRVRIFSRRHLTYKPSKFRSHVEYHLEYDVNILLLLSIFLCMYYSALFSRLILFSSGSDLSLMIIQSVKALLIGLFMCCLNKSVISLIKGDLSRLPLPPRTRRSHGSFVSTSSLHATRSSTGNTGKFIFD